MGMRLLPKSEVDRAKAAEQLRGVQEGLKLARRVDTLREVAADTEASLEKFRSETVTHLHEEIKKESERLEKVRAEADAAEQRRTLALEPLDSAWAEVIAQRGVVDSRGKDLDKRATEIEDARKEVSESTERVRKIIHRALEKDAESDSRLREASRDAEKADNRLKMARNIEKTLREVKERTEIELSHSRTLVSEREKNVTLRETELAAEQNKLADGWRLLRDRTALFERTIKRVT